MSKIWWLALIASGLLYPVKSLALSPIPNCGWCGTSCGEIKPNMACIALAPPEGKVCVFQDGSCMVVEKEPALDCGWCGDKCVETKPGMMCTKIAPPSNQSCVNLSGKCVVQEKKIAREGEVCGGIAGVMCDKGLFCKYLDGVDRSVVRDGTGVCVKDGSGGPICIPRPACMDGIEDPATGKMIFCDPPTGVNICPIDVKGDANKDGKVDLVDFTIWKKEYLLDGKPGMADFNKDGKVDLVDFTIWKSSYLVNKK
jgi:hypothetical protein